MQCWAKFSNVLIQWSIKMIGVKNYKTAFKVVKLWPRILASFFGHGVYATSLVRKYGILLNKLNLIKLIERLQVVRVDFWQFANYLPYPSIDRLIDKNKQKETTLKMNSKIMNENEFTKKQNTTLNKKVYKSFSKSIIYLYQVKSRKKQTGWAGEKMLNTVWRKTVLLGWYYRSELQLYTRLFIEQLNLWLKLIYRMETILEYFWKQSIELHDCGVQ